MSFFGLFGPAAGASGAGGASGASGSNSDEIAAAKETWQKAAHDLQAYVDSFETDISKIDMKEFRRLADDVTAKSEVYHALIGQSRLQGGGRRRSYKSRKGSRSAHRKSYRKSRRQQ